MLVRLALKHASTDVRLLLVFSGGLGLRYVQTLLIPCHVACTTAHPCPLIEERDLARIARPARLHRDWVRGRKP